MAPAKTKKKEGKTAEGASSSKTVRYAENTRNNSEEQNESSDFDDLIRSGSEKLAARTLDLKSRKAANVSKSAKKTHKQKNLDDNIESRDFEIPVSVPQSSQALEMTSNKKIKKRKKRVYSFSIYIHKVLQQIYPDDEITISRKAMSIMNTFIMDMFERIASECTNLLKMNKKKLLTGRVVETAVRLVIQGEISKHANSEGLKAVMKYEKSKADD